LLVTESNNPLEAARILIRLGFDDIAGHLAGGMLNWHMSGRESSFIRTLTVQDLCRLLDEQSLWILDVRSEEELKKDGEIAGSQHIHVTQIAERKYEVPRDRTVYVFCGSGMRSMIAASYLQSQGWKDLAVVLGGMAGWRSRRCPLKK
jgi:hydroxyacylglutathione hydrolase